MEVVVVVKLYVSYGDGSFLSWELYFCNEHEGAVF
jgi:hypothetical protein